ncbi:MAG: SDR family oxidoreductase [Pseudomonadota bacterium]
MGKLAGKVALITGGSSGIGLATAKLFRAEGAQLAITGRDPKRLAEAQAELGGDALMLPCDTASLDEIGALLNKVKDRFGRLDVLFLNAAAAKPTSVDLLTETQFDEVVAANFKGPYFTIQKALPVLGNSASIIFNTSIVGRAGSPSFSVYGATKAALASLGLALIGRGIRVNAVCPGPIDTGGFRRLEIPPEVLQTIECDMEARSPGKRFGTPEEVAKVVLFLASEDSAYVVGEEIVVDGGISYVCLP